MATQSSSDNQVLHDELEKAKETLNRLRFINSCAPTCCTTGKKCHCCWRHSHDVTIGENSDRAGDYPNAFRSKRCYSKGFVETAANGFLSNFSRVNSRVSSVVDPGFPRVDLARLRRQIDSLEESVRGPILSYVENMERRNSEMSESIEAIREQLLMHERVCPATIGSVSGGIRNGSYASANDFEKERLLLKQELGVSEKVEMEHRARAEELETELEIYRGKLEKSEARVKELFRSISLRQSTVGSASDVALLEKQLRQQQQLAETYFKESTAKDRELSFLTMEKYNLETEVNSLATDLEAANQQRDEASLETKSLETKLEECRRDLGQLEEELGKCKAENKRMKSHLRGVVHEERARSEKSSETQSFQEKQIKELRKKCKKYEERYVFRKDYAERLEKERDELLTRAENLSQEYKVKLAECDRLRKENEKVSKEISGFQIEASLSKTECNSSRAYLESLKNELQEAKSLMKILERSLQECKVSESKSSTEIAGFKEKEVSLRDHVKTVERERLLLSRELAEVKTREVAALKEAKQMRGRFQASEKEVKGLQEQCSGLKTDLELAKEKYFQLKQSNDELVLNKNDIEKSESSTNVELERLKVNYEDLNDRNGKLLSELKAYKRLVAEKEDQVKRAEGEVTQLHKAKDDGLKELLKRDREVAFLRARVTSAERYGGTASTRPASGLETSGQYGTADPGKGTEIYLERIVELESECKTQKFQLEELQKNQYHVRKDAQRSESLRQELASQDEEIRKLRREVSSSRQVIEDLRGKEEQLANVGEEKERVRQDVVRLQAKVEELSELKQVCEQKDEEMRALRRMSSEELDLEGRVSRMKDRCREKDEEIEELHQKVIALQVRIKDFVQQNSQMEEQMRNIKEKYSNEVREKEEAFQALKTAETKLHTLEEELDGAQHKTAGLEESLLEGKHKIATLEAGKETLEEKATELQSVKKIREEEIEELRKKVQELEEAARMNEVGVGDDVDVPDEASTPLDNSLESSRLSLSRSGRTSAHGERLDMLEEENIQLLNRQNELEDELDAAEEHAQQLKNALKAKRENMNELHDELDGVKERLKTTEKARTQLAEENEQLQEQHLLARQKIEGLKSAGERYMDESDELEKALTVSEKRSEELEKKLEEVSGKCASSEGQLQSLTERLARKEKELQIVETQVDEQRKLCDGYKTSAEKQETLIEKLRVEKASAEETFLAMKLEMAKKEGTYKAGKEKLAELQARLYETEDKLSGKMNEFKKISRENERLKREVKEMDSKIAELQVLLKQIRASDAEIKSPVYNAKFLSLNTAVKGNSQNVEGLDTKLNSAQNKISTLEVELANDLRKFSLHRTSSDIPRRGYYSGEKLLSPGFHGMRRPRSWSNLSTDGRESLSSISPLSRPGSSASFSGGVDYEEDRDERLDFEIRRVQVYTADNTSGTGILSDGKELDKNDVLSGVFSIGGERAPSEADPFLRQRKKGFSGGLGMPDRLEGLPGGSEGLPGEMKVFSGEMEGRSDGVEGLSGDMEGLSGGTEDLSIGMEGLPIDMEGLPGGTEGLSGGTEGLSGGTEGLSRGMEGLSGGMEGLSGRNEQVSAGVGGLPGGPTGPPSEKRGLSGTTEELPCGQEGSPEHVEENVVTRKTSEISQALAEEASSIFRDMSIKEPRPPSRDAVQEVVTSSSAFVTGSVVKSSPESWSGEEELIYF